jgi:transposase-like protein
VSRPPLPLDQLGGASAAAARWLADQEDGCLRDAAERFGISFQAVQQAWQRLGFGETPRTRKLRERREEGIARAKGGASATAIAAELGVPRSAIYKWCLDAGVVICNPRATDPAALEAGLEVVRAGGSIAEGTAVAGVQYAAFHRHMKRSGVRAVPFDQLRRDLKKRGRSEEAAALVEHEGFSSGDAARAVGVSPGSVRSYLKRRAP